MVSFVIVPQALRASRGITDNNQWQHDIFYYAGTHRRRRYVRVVQINFIRRRR